MIAFFVFVIFTGSSSYLALLKLNDVCRLKQWSNINSVLSREVPVRLSFACGLTDFLLLDRNLQWAADDYLRSYLLSLAGRGQLSLSRICEANADSRVRAEQFVSCIDLLQTRASFFQYVLNLPYLAEACQRCVVSQCRRRTQLLAQGMRAPATEHDKLACQKLEQAYIVLAQQTDNLADLFAQHRKFEIAERAYQDAIVSAAIADHIEEKSSGGLLNLKYSPSDSKPCRLQRFYLVYAAFLSEIKREDDALALLTHMAEICGPQ